MSPSSSRSSPTGRLATESLPRGPDLWVPEETSWSSENTDGLEVCEFVEATIRLTKGSNAGQLVRLRRWQGDLYCDIFRLENGERLFTTYELWIPRKNSKSLLGSGLALDGLFDEPGAEVYSCAADKDQAKIVFREVRAAVEASPELSEILSCYRDAVEYPATGSVYRALSSEAFTKEGLNPSRVLFDELHAQPNLELWNVMNQGSGTRERPLIVALSTFGEKTDSLGQDSLGYQQYRYCKQVLSGEIDDPSFGCRIYESKPDVDHRDESEWYPANPALGDFLRVSDMRDRCRRMPEADFRTKRLNIWISGANPALPWGIWPERVDLDRSVPDGTPVVLMVDGSWSGDSTGVVGCTLDQPHLFVLGAWENPHDGTAFRVPLDDVKQTLREACKRFHVEIVAMDPFRWQQTMHDLELEGLPIAEFPTNSVPRMVPAWKSFYDAALDGGFSHDGDARLARHVENMVLKIDAHGARPTKDGKSSQRHIDLAICAVGAFQLATIREAEPDNAAPEAILL